MFALAWRRWFVVVLALFLVSPLGAVAPPLEDDDVTLFRRVGVLPETPALMEYLRVPAMGAGRKRYLDGWIEAMRDDNYHRREEAGRHLMHLGLHALPTLKALQDSPDLDLRRRAKDCIYKIEKGNYYNLPLLMVRVLLKRQAREAVPALLAYLPFTRDADVEEEIYYTLDELAGRPGAIHPALEQALSDPEPARRAVAGCILGRVGNAGQRSRVRELLKDRSALVRLRSAQGLLTVGEPATLPALVGLLAEPSREIAWQAEELLHYAATDTGPRIAVGLTTGSERQKCVAAWQAWLAKEGGRLDWKAVGKDGRRPGLVYLGVSYSDKEHFSVQVSLVGKHTPPIQLPQFVKSKCQIWWHATDQLLVNESDDLNDGRSNLHLRRFDLTGNTVWSVRGLKNWCQEDVTIHRLLDGGCLIAQWNKIARIDGAGQLLYENALDNASSIHFTKEGRLYALTQSGSNQLDQSRGFKEFDPATGMEIRSWLPSDQLFKDKESWFAFMSANGALFLSYVKQVSDREPAILVEMENHGQVRLVTNLNADNTQSHSVARLRNGNTLLVGGPKYATSRIVEFDKCGKIVWEYHGIRPCKGVAPAFPLLRFGFPCPTDSNHDTEQFRIAQLRNNPDPLIRVRAAERLALFCPTPEIRDAIIASIDDRDLRVRLQAFECLLETSWIGTKPVSRLIDLLDDPESEIRRSAIRVLAKCKPRPTSALLAAYEDRRRSTRVREYALAAIARHSLHSDHRIIPAIRKQLRDGTSEGKIALLASLDNEDGICAIFVNEVSRLISHPDTDTSISAMSVLRQCGRKAVAAIPALLEAGRDPERGSHAFYAIATIAKSDALLYSMLLRKYQNEKVSLTKGGLLNVLVMLDTPETRVLPVLCEALQDRKCVKAALDGIDSLLLKGADATSSAASLLKVVENDALSNAIRHCATSLLERMQVPEVIRARSIMLGTKRE